MDTAKRIIYKGIDIPAKFISIGKGKSKLIPISVHRYVLHGIPTPSSLEIAQKVKVGAKDIIQGSINTTESSKALLVTYIRKRRKSAYFVKRSSPSGAVVAFITDGQLRIGWSKRLHDMKLESGKLKKREPLVFTKKDAVRIAVIRGLVDSVVFRESGVFTKEKKIIPKLVARILSKFIARSQRYFKQDASNVTTVSE